MVHVYGSISRIPWIPELLEEHLDAVGEELEVRP